MDDNKQINTNDQVNKIPEINTIPPLPGQELEINNLNNSNSKETQSESDNSNQKAHQTNTDDRSHTTSSQNRVQNNTIIKANIPNSTAVLVLGILSITSLCCCGPFMLGPILAIIALALVPRGKRNFNENPDLYRISSYKNMKAGQVCAIIGLIFGILFFIYFIIMGSFNSNNLNEINEVFDKAWNELGY